MTHVHTIFVEALRNTFSSLYPDESWRSLKISMEYPASKDDYPGIWLAFDPIGQLRTVGIGHVEDDIQEGVASSPIMRRRRWSFAGRVSFTIVTLSGLERYRLYDELVKIIAFSQQKNDRAIFRNTIEQDPLMMVTVNWDEIDQAGFGASQGTPWGGDEILYEATLQITCIGEFISDEQKGILLPISGVDVFYWADPPEHDPTTPGGWT